MFAFEEAIHFNPENDDAYCKKGNTLYNLKCYDEAVVAYEEAIRLNPERADAYQNKRLALNNLINDLEQVIKLYPHNANAHYNKGNALYKLELYNDAADAYDRVLDMIPGHAEARDNRRTALESGIKNSCELFLPILSVLPSI